MSFPSSTTFSTTTSRTSPSEAWQTSWPNVTTTPYVYRPQCTSLLKVCAAGPRSPNPEFSHADTSFYCMRTDGTSWRSCQPRTATFAGSIGDGWYREEGGRVVGIGTRYQGAVCPSGWWALSVGLTRQAWETRTSATCCSLGDELGVDVWGVYTDLNAAALAEGTQRRRVCVGTRNIMPEDGTGSGELRTAEAYYPGWAIDWHDRDLQYLSPPWPRVTSNMLIPTWTEGMSWREGEFDNKGSLTLTSSSAQTYPPRQKSEDEIQRDKTTGELKIWLPIGTALGIAVVILIWALLRCRMQAKPTAEQGIGTRGEGIEDDGLPAPLPPRVWRRAETERPPAVMEKKGRIKGARGRGTWWMRKLERKEVRENEMDELEIEMGDVEDRSSRRSEVVR